VSLATRKTITIFGGMEIDDLLGRLPLGAGFTPPPVVSVIRLAGIIGQLGPLQRGLSLAALAPVIDRAFAPKHLAAVALAVNSPGGSPAQSLLIAERIHRLGEEKQVPVLAFVEDVAASGGYWLALAADEIFATEASIVGSIGVVSAGFGFSAVLERLGIERRVYTQGVHKVMLDPFQPEKAEDVARLTALQAELHQIFKETVRRCRGARLTAEDGVLFEGDIWTGAGALALGLIDGIGEMRSELRRRFGDKVKLRPVAQRQAWLRRRLGMVSANEASVGEMWAAGAMAALEERAWWARYGL